VVEFRGVGAELALGSPIPDYGIPPTVFWLHYLAANMHPFCDEPRVQSTLKGFTGSSQRLLVGSVKPKGSHTVRVVQVSQSPKMCLVGAVINVLLY